MIKRVLRRSIREPIPCIAAVLFTAILTVILCFLHRSQMEEQQNFDNTYRSTPITFEITWLDGTRLNNSAPASGHMADILPELFLGTCSHQPQFDDLVADLQIRMSYYGTLCAAPMDADTEAEPEIITEHQQMVGITSAQVAKEQNPQFKDSIEWYDGFDESIFRTNQFVCVAPSSFDGMDEIMMTFSNRGEYTCTFRIVGLYTETGNNDLYCPYAVIEQIYARVNEPKHVQHLSGRLANNDDLELFRERAKEWFATPNPLGDPTPWGKMSYEYYPLAIDINDSLLKNLESDMQQSMTINRIAAMLVFLLSAGAGFLTGFLVIRSRKREIGLMRTLGNSNGSVCLEFGLEQLLCVVAGVILGGSYSLWEPIEQLCLFAGVYLAGLSIALIVFTRTNLLATMKEDE